MPEPDEVDPPRIDVVVDTGVFLAAADTDEPRHGDCAAILAEHLGHIATTPPVVAEAAWLIEARFGPAAERLKDTTLATLNTRDLHVVRPAHADAFELIPTPAR